VSIVWKNRIGGKCVTQVRLKLAGIKTRPFDDSVEDMWRRSQELSNIEFSCGHRLSQESEIVILPPVRRAPDA